MEKTIRSDEQNLIERTKASEKVFDGKLLQVYRDTVILPNQNTATREYIQHIGAVAVVPVLEDGRIIVERQFRYPLNAVITEIPAGKLDSNQEDRLEAAKRELREETGYIAEEWKEIGDYIPAAAYCDERITIYLARGLKKGEQELDEDEFLHVEAVPLEKLMEQVMTGEITDGKTLAGLLKAARILG